MFQLHSILSSSSSLPFCLALHFSPCPLSPSSHTASSTSTSRSTSIQLTLTTLSQPAEIIKGLEGFGLNLTQETHSEWPSSLMSNLHSPKVFQSLMVLSLEPETIWRLSAEKETERTSAVCPTNLLVVVPEAKSQRRKVLSQEEERANWPSEEMTMSETKWLCPCRILFG